MKKELKEECVSQHIDKLKQIINTFKWENDLSRFNKGFTKNYDKNSDVGYFLEVDVEYPKKIFDSHRDLPILPERKKLEKVGKPVCRKENRRICHSHKSFKTSTR